MHRTIDIAVYKKTAFFGSVPIAMWGAVGELFGTSGMPYLTVSKHIKLITTREFIQIYRSEVQKMLRLFPRLENVVDSEYPEAIKALRLAGFTVGEEVSVSVFDNKFRLFSIGGDEWVR